MRSKLHKFLKDRFGTLCTVILLLVISQGAWAGTLPNSGESYTFHSEKVTGYGTTSDVAFTRLDNNHFVCQFTLEGGSGNSHKYQFSLKCSNGNYYRKNNQHFSGADTEATDITATSGNFMDIQCTTATTYYVFVELWCENGGDSKLIVRLSTASNFYLGGYLNAGDVNSHNNNWKLTQNGSNYEGVFTFTTNHVGAQWLWVLDASDNKWGTFGDVTTTVGGTSTIYQKVTSSKVKAPTTIGKEYKVTFTPSTGALKWERNITTVPTVNIAANESVAGDGVSITLNGYVKYNGCKTISEYGFVYGTGNTPTTSDNKVKVGENNISRGSSYSKTFEESTNETYNYRAYIIAGSTTYYSSEIRQFTIDLTCDLSSLDATIDGGSSSVKVFSSGTSESATLSSVTFANVYHWECTSENSSHVTFENANQRETTVTVSEEGMYTFRLGAKCTGDDNYTYSENVTLYTCAKPDGTLLLDGYSANILCQDEMATATIKSRSGYTYTLYRGETEIASLTGNGRTLKWHNVEGEGTFTVKAHPTALPACTHTLSSATQSYNIPNIGIDISPASAVPAFTPVTLTKSDASTIDKEPFWEITEGASTGYLLNGSTSIKYDDRARHSVIFKGGLVVESNEEVTTFYKVKAKGYKKVNLETGDNATTKECESSVVIELSTFKASPCQ